ncbi:universal stress protein [Salinibaculum rarum]|uniref:universal stress protein n=1 Tax=Salinibaculum rarum TaxID=3058903 RepID=UPI00265DEDBA|nr:universal stress protein [Salinibaculum sp. KK48]
MNGLFDRVVLPLASPEDARASCLALKPYVDGEVIAVHVVEKAGGAPDKAGIEQREAYAEEIFDVVDECLGDDHYETEIRYGTDVAETIFAAAADHDATAIVITPRGGSRWIRLLTGDVALDIVTETDRPVVVLPDKPEENDDQTDSESPTEGESS